MDASVTALKTSRKRKKNPTGNATNNPTKKQKFSRNSDASRELAKKKKSFSKKYSKSQSSNLDIQNANKYGKSNKFTNVDVSKKLKKNLLKTRDLADTQSLIPSKHMLKTKKNKRFNKVPNSSAQDSLSASKDTSVSPAVKKAPKVKKGKKKQTSNLEENINSESNDELSDICISDDDGSDEEVLREEIQNSSIFKQIEKLMKKAPHLNPANAGLKSPVDSNAEDNCSDLSLSDDEDSEMENDDQEASSSESDIEKSVKKHETAGKKENTSVKRQDKNALQVNRKNNFSETVAESTGFNRTSKDNAIRKNVSDKDKKGIMSSNLKNKVQEKLAGAKFRFLNEKLYTETGKEAFKYFQENTEEFDDYHSGYRLQVSKWPMNPVNEIIADIQKLKKSTVIADLGCGEAKIAQAFPNRTVHSFDLVPLNEFVKACDISKIPLPNQSVDVVVFCLSLMGTNLKDYLCEAFRILKMGGILKIAEVDSRIEDLSHFINYLKSIGFKLERKNTKHKMFVFLDLKKEKQKCKLGKVPSLSLRPCMYKKR